MLLVCLCSRASRAKLCCCWSPSVNVSLTTGLAPNFSLVSFFHSFCVYLTRIWPVRYTADTFLFSPFDRFLTHLLQPPFICVFHHLFLFSFSSLPNTPQTCHAPLRPVFSLWDHPPQSMDRLPSHLPHALSHVYVSKLYALALQAEG